MKENYLLGKSDLFAGFILRCSSLACTRGLSAMVTMQSWMFLSSYEKLRAEMWQRQHIQSMLHLGTRAFGSIGGEVVSSTAFVTENSLSRETQRMGVYIRLVDFGTENEKIKALLDALQAKSRDKGYFTENQSEFRIIPGGPAVYWLSEKMRNSFKTGKRLDSIVTPVVGLRTGDNERFLRRWWEVSQNRTLFGCADSKSANNSGMKWFPYNKGGAFRRWYGNHEYVVNWKNDGYEVETELARRYPYMVPAGQNRLRGQGRDYYFSPSVSWSDISSGEAAFRRYPRGFIHDSTGHSAFGSEETLNRIIFLLNSNLAKEFLLVLAPTLHFHIGYLSKIPVSDKLNTLSLRLFPLVETAQADWDTVEQSWNFTENPLIAQFQDCLSQS